MEKLQLEKRTVVGKKVKHIKKEGKTPAVVFNSKGESTNVSMSTTDADWLSRNASSTYIIDTVLGKKTFKTLVKELDINPVNDEINHVALFQIDENAVMIFTIPFEMVGISPAVKNNLGVLINVLVCIEVRCKLSDLQSSIKIDVSNLEHPGQTINMTDIKLPKGISLINDDQKNATIVTITDIQKIEEPITPVEEEGEEGEVEGAEGETTSEETPTGEAPAEETPAK